MNGVATDQGGDGGGDGSAVDEEDSSAIDESDGSIGGDGDASTRMTLTAGVVASAANNNNKNDSFSTEESAGRVTFTAAFPNTLLKFS
eukprot:scaffold6061_cov156-Amphora_coffeaeformis.AAC.5